MKLAMRLADKAARAEGAERDPREGESAEIISLASRTAYPAVTQRKGKSDALGMVAGIAIVAVLGLATLWVMDSARIDQGRAPAVDQRRAGTPPSSLPGGAIAQPQPLVEGAPVPDGSVNPAMSPMPQPMPGTRLNPYNTPTVVFDASALPAPVGLAAPVAPTGDGASGTAGDFASRIGGVGGGPAQARNDIDPRTTVTQGTMIPAVLETAIDTDVPGYVRAVVSQDVRSFDGTRVLVPRSSRLIGQYQSGLQGGQKRAYVIWTRLIRPDGVSVNLASPATGFDGAAGLAGKVDTHFFQRFGSAMLLSVVGGLSAIGSGGAGLILGGGQSAAAAAVTQGNNIGPTIRVRQGEPIRVFTARDLDFSRVEVL